MKFFKIIFSFLLCSLLLTVWLPSSFAKKGKMSQKKCEKAIEHIFELTLSDYKEEQKEIPEEKMKEIRQRWNEAKGQLVEQCQEKATKKGIKCVMESKKIDEATQCPD